MASWGGQHGDTFRVDGGDMGTPLGFGAGTTGRDFRQKALKMSLGSLGCTLWGWDRGPSQGWGWEYRGVFLYVLGQGKFRGGLETNL